MGTSEWASWLPLVGQLGLPALVAAIVTATMNWRLEKIRGRRDINTKLFDLARESVRQFAKITAVYWSKEKSAGDVEVETEILLLQQDVLVDVANCLTLSLSDHRSEIETSIDELVRFGTGGEFQGADRRSDLHRAQQITGAAARLRRVLTVARRELQERRSY